VVLVFDKVLFSKYNQGKTKIRGAGMAIKVTENVTWVGKTDWELENFHGREYTTRKGSTYNSYLISDKKNVLVDTVWQPYAGEFIKNLKKVIPLNKIDYIVINHAEIDHSGALPELMLEIPNTPIYCTQNAIKSIQGHYHQDWNFIPVKTGDTLELGDKCLVFVEAKMLHWPDSMFCYLSGDSVLFSNDAFGQHYCTEFMFNDLVDGSELYEEAFKYYANILSPFSKLVTQKITEIAEMGLPLNVICPSHGVIWRNEPLQIVDQYMEWAADYKENQVTIVYDTMWNGTRRMAETIANGIREANGGIAVKLFNCSHADKTEIIAEIFRSKVLLVGSSTINNGILSSVAGILEMIKGAKLQNKMAAAFGAYGWSGESVKIITEELRKAGLNVLNDGIKEQWNPDDEAITRCIEFGRDIAEKNLLV